MDTSDGKNIPDANFYTGISSTILKTNILLSLLNHRKIIIILIVKQAQKNTKR